jgi:hypothetical protein
MRENTRGYRRKTVNLHVELVSDDMRVDDEAVGFEVFKEAGNFMDM